MNDKHVAAAADLDFIKQIMMKTNARIDPHAFHFVMWGALVLLCYPLLNWFELNEKFSWMLGLGVTALVLGSVGSAVFEMRLARKPRIEGENTFVSRQVTLIVFANIPLGVLLSSVAPAMGIVPHDQVSIVWGFLYANMAYMVGVVYMREYLLAGIAILIGTLVAWPTPHYRGFILGPFMGLGMIIPGLMAERRVARLRE